MDTKDLIAGYAAYTDAAELGIAGADAPAISVVSPTQPSITLTPTIPVTTIELNC